MDLVCVLIRLQFIKNHLEAYIINDIYNRSPNDIGIHLNAVFNNLETIG